MTEVITKYVLVIPAFMTGDPYILVKQRKKGIIGFLRGYRKVRVFSDNLDRSNKELGDKIFIQLADYAADLLRKLNSTKALLEELNQQQFGHPAAGKPRSYLSYPDDLKIWEKGWINEF